MQNILNRSLKLIEKIYDQNMYNDNGEMFRIKDIIHSLDSNHIVSKEWLAETLLKLYKFKEGKFFVGGGWYGLCAHSLREKFPDAWIISSDIDPTCEKIGWELFPDSNIEFSTENSMEYDIADCSAIITTSGEHISPEALKEWIGKKNKNCWAVIQSNNFFAHASHVNCYKTLDAFEESLDLRYVAFKGELDLGDFRRFMVIGK